MENIDSIHRIAGGIYLTLGGTAPLVVLETDLDPELLFDEVKAWARGGKIPVTACNVRGRPGLRTADSVLVDGGGGMFLDGPEGLVTRTLDLSDRRATGCALDPTVEHLARTTIQDGTALVVAGVTPPGANGWLEERNLPSVVGARFLLAARTPDAIHLRLGLIPGKPIKPIWFAQEVNSFLVRAAKDESIVELGLADWIEGLEVELSSRGIVVRGSIGAERLVEVLGRRGGET
jgi:hypothetical protein